ncbi:MAG: UPF0758 domain-containing protein [Candidatus Binatia bacterium]
MTRHSALSPASEASTEKTQTWHHPGGKLIELGSHALKQDELLAILIGSGVAGRSALAIANAILNEYVGLYGIPGEQELTIENDARHIPQSIFTKKLDSKKAAVGFAK